MTFNKIELKLKECNDYAIYRSFDVLLRRNSKYDRAKMRLRLFNIIVFCCVCFPSQAQERIYTDEIGDDYVPRDFQEMPSLTKFQYYRSKRPVMLDGEPVWDYLMPELPVYKPLVFKSERERQQFNRLVANVKRVLPLARMANMMLEETYQVLETLPTKEEKDAHIKAVERDIKKQYTPEMKKLTYSQGKLLIKLVDRECNQSSYEIVQAFLGPARAAFYQIFAWTFKASLKKEYDPEGDDRLIERVVRQIEVGQL